MMVRIEDNTIRHPRDARLNLLLSCGAGREGPALEQLPRLLSPMGIYSIKVTSGESAARVRFLITWNPKGYLKRIA